MKKVLIIDNSLDLTGAFKAILANAIDLKEDFEFHFLIPNKSINKNKIVSLGFTCIQLNMIEISKRPLSNLLYFPQLIINSIIVARYTKRNRIFIIHVNDLYNMTGLLTKFWKRLFVITHIRRMPESFPLFIYKRWVSIHKKFSDSFIPVSKANARIFEPSAKIEVVYDKLPGKEQQTDYECVNRERLKLLYLANFNRGKGQEHAIKVAELLLKNGFNNFELNFYGGDFNLKKNKDFKAELEQEVIKLGLSSNVHFFNKSETVEREMKGHDIILNFSDSESFSNVSLEALFYGVPLVATNVGGTSEMFEHKFSGYLVEKENIQEMYQAVKELINSYDLRSNLSLESKRIVRDRFGIENTSYKLKKVYSGF